MCDCALEKSDAVVPNMPTGACSKPLFPMRRGDNPMRYLTLMLVALLLTGCSEAERSATTPAPNAAYVASPAMTEADAKAAAASACQYYHSEPATPAGQADTLARFECTGRARGGDSFLAEDMGL